MNEMTVTGLIEHISGRIRVFSKYQFKDNAPRIECADGESLSVQASETHYCSPRQNEAMWTEVEVGFPSKEPPETWREYFDGNWDEGDRTGSVYGFVPIFLVLDYINSHGGSK